MLSTYAPENPFARARSYTRFVRLLSDGSTLLYQHEHDVLNEAAGALLADHPQRLAQRAAAREVLMMLVESGRWQLDPAADLQAALDGCGVPG